MLVALVLLHWVTETTHGPLVLIGLYGVWFVWCMVYGLYGLYRWLYWFWYCMVFCMPLEYGLRRRRIVTGFIIHAPQTHPIARIVAECACRNFQHPTDVFQQRGTCIDAVLRDPNKTLSASVLCAAVSC